MKIGFLKKSSLVVFWTPLYIHIISSQYTRQKIWYYLYGAQKLKFIISLISAAERNRRACLFHKYVARDAC